MKKIFLLGIIFVLFVFPISALEISSSKNVFDQGETLIVTLEGNILEPITKQDVGFFLGHEQKPFDYDIVRIDNTYFIYAILPYNENQYTLRISDVYFKENNQFITEDLNFDFVISNLTADFYVKPGTIVTNENFTLELYNNLNSPINVNYGFEDNSSVISLSPQTTTTLNVNTDSFLVTIFRPLTLQSSNTAYEIPIQIIKPGTIEEDPDIEIPIVPGSSNILFSVIKLDELLNRGDVYEYFIGLKNTGDEPSGEITLSTSEEIRDFIIFSNEIIENILPEEEVEVAFIIDPQIVGFYEGKIFADSEESSDSFELLFTVGEEVEVVSSFREENTCADLEGLLCNKCEGSQIPSSDGFCCIGVCSLNGEEPDSNINTTAIVVVLVLLLLIIGFIGFRMKKNKRKDPIKKRVGLLGGSNLSKV